VSHASNPLPDFDTWWEYDHPEATEVKLREALPLAEQAGDRGYLAELLTQIARTEGLQRRFAEAHATLDRVEGMLGDDLPRAQVRYLLERGRVFNSSKHPDEARPLFLAAWELGRAHGEDFHAIDAAHMLAIVAPPEESNAWNRMALELAEQTQDARAKKWLGSLYNNMGWPAHDQGDYQEALRLFEQALAAREVQGDATLIRVAHWCIARTLRSLERVEEALAIQERLLREQEESGEPGEGYTEEETGECLLALNRQDEAQPFFARAYAKLSKDPWPVEGEAERLERLKRLGKV
jgi:tetratricopeptide (TPR) repeat protein